MQILFLSILFISTLFVGWLPQSKEFTSKEGRFVVNFPATPELSEAPLNVSGVKGEIHNLSVIAGNITFTVAYTDYTTIDPSLLSDERKFVNSIAGGFSVVTKGDLRGGINTSFNSYPGRSIKVFFNDRVAFSRFYLVERRMYQLLVITEKKFENDNADKVSEFFDSFKLIDAKDQIVVNKNDDLKNNFDPSAPRKKVTKPASSSSSSSSSSTASTDTNTKANTDTDTKTDPTAAKSDIYTPGLKNIKSPQILEKSKPTYTDQARKKGVEGIVVLSAVFRKNKKITDIMVINGLGYELDEEAIEAAKKIKFIPGQKDGEDVNVRARLEFTFSLIY